MLHPLLLCSVRNSCAECYRFSRIKKSKLGMLLSWFFETKARWEIELTGRYGACTKRVYSLVWMMIEGAGESWTRSWCRDSREHPFLDLASFKKKRGSSLLSLHITFQSTWNPAFGFSFRNLLFCCWEMEESIDFVKERTNETMVMLGSSIFVSCT